MMHHIKTGCIVLLALLVSVAAFVACDFGGGDTQLGSLEIILQDRIAARTIAPLLDMEVDLWNIRANRVGSDYQIGPVDVTADTHSFTGILSGTWVVTVEAYNNDSPRVKIGEGSSTVVVQPGKMTQTSISVVPLTGNGSFSFTLDWTGNLIDSPSLEAYLTAESASVPASVAASDISITGSTATITVDEVPTGYYDFIYVLKNGTQVFAGNFHEVRILAGQESSASETVPVSPLGLSLSIVNNLRNPFEVSISSHDFVLECANSQSFFAAPADAAAYQWYLDGMMVAGADGDVFEIDGEGFPLGWHTVSVKVKQFDGSLSSDTKAFLVDPISGTGGWMELTFINIDDENDVYHFWMTSGPAEDSGFDAFGTFPEYNVPIHLEMFMEKDPDDYQMGSFMLASSVPLDIDAELDMFPLGGESWDEHMTAAFGPWGVTSDTVVLDQAYAGCLFTGKIADGYGFRKDFNAVGNFHNPVIVDNPGDEPDVLKHGDLSAVDGVSVTFSKYGTEFGSYVKGTVSGSVVSVDYRTPEQTLGVYSVTGEFVSSRGEMTTVL